MLENILAIIICFVSCSSFAQSRFYFNTGIGTYSMNDLKNFQADIISETPVKLQTIKSFPAYINFEGGFDVKLGEKFFVGAGVGYGSTGCRSDYQDYSGILRMDQLWRYTSVGISGGVIQKFMNDKLLLRYELRSGFTFNKGKLISTEGFGSQRTTEATVVTSKSAYAQPTFTATRRFGPIGLDAYIGFNLSVYQGKIYDEGFKSGGYYGFSNATPIGVEWTGLRAGVGLSLLIGK